MMRYDFDTEVCRQGTCSAKWSMIQRGQDPFQREFTDEFFGPDRILPMWVADMDFPSPKPVVDALVARAQHGIFGYTVPTDSYYEAVVKWMKRRHGWEIAPEWICITPGVIPALNMLVRTVVAPGEKVIVQPPVYYPFFDAVTNNGGELVMNPLCYEGGRYHMDFDDLLAKVRDPQVKMLILCSPHNPVGRVWTRDELARLGEICLEHGVLVASDEIHGDLIYKGHTFTPYGTLGEAFAQNAVICTAPSKTFNLAGLHTSNIIIPSEGLRLRFRKVLRACGLFGVNAFGVVACEVAYNEGEEWLAQVMEYIEGNYSFLEAYVAEHIPQITVIRPEGTYLVWLDCRRLGLDKWALKELMLEKARVYLDEGFIFGQGGEGFERINIACPRCILEEALQRIEKAVKQMR